MADTRRMTKDAAISVVPANEASWEDLQAVFGTRGDASRCQCQYFKIRDFQWRSVPVDERAQRLREQTGCGHPGARPTSGRLLAATGGLAALAGAGPASTQGLTALAAARCAVPAQTLLAVLCDRAAAELAAVAAGDIGDDEAADEAVPASMLRWWL